jgi:hypothetical protein
VIIFSKDLVDRFTHANKVKSYGQSFLDFTKIKIEKLGSFQDQEFCNRLRDADDVTAKCMITSRINKMLKSGYVT